MSSVGRASMRRPLNSMLPAVWAARPRFIMPTMARSRVDLPAPLAPTMEWIVPFSTVKPTP